MTRPAVPDTLAALVYGRAASACRHGLQPLAVLALLAEDDGADALSRDAAKALGQSAAQVPDLPSLLRRHPRLFAAASADWLEAAEAAGRGLQGLELLAEDHRRLGTLRRALRETLRWPLVLSTLLLALVAMLLGFVMPSLAEVFVSFGADLPAPTLAAMALSRGFVAGGWALPLLLVAVAAAWKAGWGPVAWRELMGRVLESLPGLRRYLGLRRDARLAAWMRALHDAPALWPTALAHLEATAPGATDRTALRTLAQRLAAGATLSDALTALPGHSGRLAGLLRLAGPDGAGVALAVVATEADDDEVDTLRHFEQTLLLAMYLFIGVAVAMLLVSLYLPIFKLGAVV